MKMKIFRLTFLLVWTAFSLLAQTEQRAFLTGSVRDALTDEPVELALVYVQGSNQATETAVNGRYRLEVPAEAAFTLVFSRTGYKETTTQIPALPPGAGRGESSTLPRAIIVAGITERQLQTLMAVCRKTGMKQALWATLTPTSETWLLKQLLAELTAERKALHKKG